MRTYGSVLGESLLMVVAAYTHEQQRDEDLPI
jgi:hypothetical protein